MQRHKMGHVNCMMVTTPSSSHLMSIERLQSETAENYRKHISNCIKNLTYIYSIASEMSFACCHRAVFNEMLLVRPGSINLLTFCFCFCNGQRVGHQPNWIKSQCASGRSHVKSGQWSGLVSASNGRLSWHWIHKDSVINTAMWSRWSTSSSKKVKK